MKTKKEINQLWRISLLVFGITTIIYLGFILFTGNFPPIANLNLKSEYIKEIIPSVPDKIIFLIPRGLDFLILPFFTALIVSIFQVFEKLKKPETEVPFIIFIIFGFFLNLAFWMCQKIVTLDAIFIGIIILTIGYFFMIPLRVKYAFGIGFGLGSGICFGLSMGFYLGGLIGLITAIILSLIATILHGFFQGVKIFFRAKFWKKLYYWLAGE